MMDTDRTVHKIFRHRFAEATSALCEEVKEILKDNAILHEHKQTSNQTLSSFARFVNRTKMTVYFYLNQQVQNYSINLSSGREPTSMLSPKLLDFIGTNRLRYFEAGVIALKIGNLARAFIKPYSENIPCTL